MSGVISVRNAFTTQLCIDGFQRLQIIRSEIQKLRRKISLDRSSRADDSSAKKRAAGKGRKRPCSSAGEEEEEEEPNSGKVTDV